MTDSEFTVDLHQKLPQTRTAELLSCQTHSVLDWRIRVTLKDGYIGLFLLCDGDQVQDVGWSCQVTASLTLHNFLDDKKNLSRNINHKLTDKDPDWGYHHFILRSEVTTPGSGFLSTSGQLYCSATVVAAFPMYSLNTQNKPGGAGDSRKERGKSKAVVTGCGEGEGVVKTILRELVQEVVLWSVEKEEETVVETSSEEESSSSESEGSDGEVSEEELEWLAKDLRNMLNVYSLTRGEGKTLKVCLKEVQEELVRQRRGVSRRRRPKERHLRPGYRVTEDDWGRRVRGQLSHKVLGEYMEEEDPDYIPPRVGEEHAPNNPQEDETPKYFEESELTFYFKNKEQALDREVLQVMKKEIEKNLIEMGRTHYEIDVSVQCVVDVPVASEKKMNPVSFLSKQAKCRDFRASEEKTAETLTASPVEGVTRQGQICLEGHEGVAVFPRVTLKPELLTIWEEEDESVGTMGLEGEENRGRKDTVKSVPGSSDGNLVTSFESNLLGRENKNIPEMNLDTVREDAVFETKQILEQKVREVECIKVSPEVMKALQGMDGAIRLLETAREELCRQAGLPGPPGGLKCYRAGCLERATLKCSSCLQVQYCSVQCTEMAWREQHGLECRQLSLVKPSAS